MPEKIQCLYSVLVDHHCKADNIFAFYALDFPKYSGSSPEQTLFGCELGACYWSYLLSGL